MGLEKNLKKSVASGMIWGFSERILAQLVTFVVTVILARLISPESYGAIAIVNIFISIANVLVTGGFGNALIQKKDADDIDFSSVFYFNIFIGTIFCSIIFIAAPYIAAFYNMQILTPVLRFMGFKLILASINSVQHAYVSRNMLFRRFFWSTLGGTAGAAVIGIGMAYANFGVWALAAQYMFNSMLDTLILWFTVKWRPKKLFSFARLKSLFVYGWKILATSLLRSIYSELRGIVIGKVYTPADLAQYTKGKGFPSLIVTNLCTAVINVIFPTMSKVQDEKQMLKAMTRRIVRIHSFVSAPLLIGLFLVAHPLIELLLTPKWLPCVPFLQATCILFLFEPIQLANLQAIKAIGRSDIYLKLETIKKTIGIIVLIITLKNGVWAIIMGEIAVEFLAACLNIYPNKKFINYSYMECIGAQEIAEKFGFERSYLFRIFKARYGVGVKEYLTAVRMEHAAQFLKSGQNVATVSSMVGYRDVFNFSKAFKKYYGISPAKYKVKDGR